jgi:hypothetical protein
MSKKCGPIQANGFIIFTNSFYVYYALSKTESLTLKPKKENRKTEGIAMRE